MNLQRLLEEFETLAEAPGGVARLRELVLQLAVRGQLVPQDPGDEPASVLLERVAEEKARSIHFKDGADEESFVAMREARDKTLDMPKLILPSIQVNIRAGQLPEPEENGVRYLKLPLNQF